MITPSVSMSRTNSFLGILSVTVMLCLVYGLYRSQNMEDFTGYTAILISASLPSVYWLQNGAMGIPILPVSAGLYWIYYGLPAARGTGEAAGYSPDQVLVGCATVAIFLLVAGIIWARMLRAARRRSQSSLVISLGEQAAVILMYAGLALGLAFYLAPYTGLLGNLGSFWGLFRAVTLTPGLLGCYLLGYCRAKGLLRGQRWALAVGMLVLLLALQMNSLFLVGVATQMIAAISGYVFTARRVPWKVLILGFAALSIFQAGKGEVRAMQRESNLNSNIYSLPSKIHDWFDIGLNAILSDRKYLSMSVTTRASLLDQILRVQAWTPSQVPYLYGETYSYLPSLLVPRFINPDRPASQIVMGELDVRYGFLTREATKYTAVGVNIIPEAFANFGYIGIIIISVVYGYVTGLLSSLSIGQSAVSLGTLIAIAALICLIDMEADASYLMTNFFQSAVATVIFFFATRSVVSRLSRMHTSRRRPILLNARSANARELP